MFVMAVLFVGAASHSSKRNDDSSGRNDDDSSWRNNDDRVWIGD